MYKEYGRKVNLLVVSYGGPISHYFLTKYPNIDQKWKDKYIANYFTMVAAWTGGVNKGIERYLTGLEDLMPIQVQDLNDYLNDLVRSWEVLLWLGPNSVVWGDDILVTTNKGRYSADNFTKLFTDHDIGEDSGVRMEQLRYLSYDSDNTLLPPNVPTYCYYGIGQPTPVSFDYSKCSNFPDCKAHEIKVSHYDSGDGLVTRKGAEACLAWKNMKSHKFEAKAYRCTHKKPIEMMEDILDIILNGPGPSKLTFINKPTMESDEIRVSLI